MAAVVLTETPGGDPFAGIPAGPVLASALAAVDVAGMPGQHVAAWMRTVFRQRNHDDAVLLEAIRQACRSRADSCRRVRDDGFAPRIAAANLGWSAVTAGARYRPRPSRRHPPRPASRTTTDEDDEPPF